MCFVAGFRCYRQLTLIWEWIGYWVEKYVTILYFCWMLDTNENSIRSMRSNYNVKTIYQYSDKFRGLSQ